MSVRTLYTPYKGRLKRVEEKIADLEASSKPYAAGTNTSEAQRKKEAIALLRLDKAPSVGWSVVTEIGFAGWVLSALGLALAINLKQKDKRGRRAFMWGLFLTFFLALWLVGMVNA